MVTGTHNRQSYVRQKTDTSDAFPVFQEPLRPRADSNLEEESPPLAQNPVVWTAIGVLASSWLEYTRRTSFPGDQQQWQAEWLTWAAMFITTQVVLFVQGSAADNAAGRRASLPPGQFMLGYLNVLIIAVMNSITRSLFLKYDLRYALPLVTVTSCAAWFISTRKEYHLLGADTERSSLTPDFQAVTRRSLNVAIAAAIPSTVLLLTPQAVAPGLGSLSIRTVIYLLCQTMLFIALSGRMLNLPNGKMLDYPTKLLEGLSLSSMMLWTMIMMVFGLPAYGFKLSTVGLVIARSFEWSALVSISVTGYPITATIISTVGVSIGGSFASSMSDKTGQVAIVAVIGILHALTTLPSLRSGRNYLLLLILLPSWSLLRQTHANLTTATGLHPIETLVNEAKVNFAHVVERQSKTLYEAVAEYKRRYKRYPPPNFDIWYNMATKNNVIPLIDEFDTLMRPFETFWGIPPSLIRERLESAFDIHTRRVHRFEIRDHRWLANSTNTGRYAYVGEEMGTWLKPEHLVLLPNMTWGHNFWDEPRVYAPHDAVQQAKANTLQPLAKSQQVLGAEDQQTTTSGPSGAEVNWLKLEHRNAWEAMNLACPIDSPARSPPASSSSSGGPSSGSPSFITDLAAHLDFCSNPELAKSHGFVLAPAAFDMTHTLFPLFSSCAPSIANDIVIPPAYTGLRFTDGVYEYDPAGDIAWQNKQASVYWKGSSTGGWATEDNWWKLHRQRLSLKFTEAEDSNANVTLLRQQPGGLMGTEQWIPYEAPLSSMAHKFDIHFAGELVLCSFLEKEKQDPKSGGCYEEKQHLKMGELGTTEEAWTYKYNLDIDGNGYSGRFLRLLMSNSAPIKMTVFREWISDWIVPWVHYFPAKQDHEFSDLPEMMNFLTSERGDVVGKDVAEMGQKWTNKVISKEALRLWFLRLLMEYGRVTNDDRDHMNFIA